MGAFTHDYFDQLVPISLFATSCHVWSNLAYFYNNINFNLILLTILGKDRKKHGSFIFFLSQKVKTGLSSFHFGVGIANWNSNCDH